MVVYGQDLSYDHFHRAAHKNYGLRSLKICHDVSRKLIISPVYIQVHGIVERAGNMLVLRVPPPSAAFIRMVERDMMSVYDALEERMNPASLYSGMQCFYSCEGSAVIAVVSKHAPSFRVDPGKRVVAQLAVRGVYHSPFSKGMVTDWILCNDVDQSE